MVGDLEQVDTAAVCDARGQQLRIHVILDVAHEQEAPLAVAQIEHERRVVDRATVLG